MEFDATFLIAVISFIVFVVIMNKIFYEPVLKIMQQRQELVNQNFISAKITKKTVQEKTVQYDSELEKSRDEARNEIADKSKQFKDESSKILAGYKEELYSDVLNEKENLKNSALAAKDVLKNSIVNVARDVSIKIMGTDYNVDSIDVSQVEE
ncbi:MAG: ATP synthase F0 subunit B [Candidatus Gastranaerophilales bacterium]|nr:ATP synthase F0 subunit B [Candidatus Gastranaerophilales bacterium]